MQHFEILFPNHQIYFPLWVILQFEHFISLTPISNSVSASLPTFIVITRIMDDVDDISDGAHNLRVVASSNIAARRTLQDLVVSLPSLPQELQIITIENLFAVERPCLQDLFGRCLDP